MYNAMQFINGEKVKGSGEVVLNINPATQEELGNIYYSNEKDLESAIQSAKIAQKIWRNIPGSEKSNILRNAASILRDNVKELAMLETLDTGKPISESLSVDIYSGADCLDYFAGVSQTISGDYFKLPNAFAYTQKNPLGIVAGIGAWNYPIQIACWKSAPALACGNAMIFKPSELTPLTAIRLAEIYKEAGLPDGLFNVLQGDYKIGEKLTTHKSVRKVTLTGEISTGKKVMQNCATTLKHVTLELGGKSPLVVTNDCCIETAVSTALMANFYTQGEICSNGTRVFVHEDIYAEFLERITKRVKEIKVGDPLDPKTQIGALISKDHKDKVLSYINKGKEEGAKLLVESSNFQSKGNFVAPIVFSDCTDEMTIVKEEIFGPVMSVLKWKDDEEVIRRANNTNTGLAAGVICNNIKRSHYLANNLESGIVWINNYNITPIEIPFGGVKESGQGRENSFHCVNHYTELKTVYVEMGDVESVF